MVDTLNYVFQVRPKHPTSLSLSPPLRIRCEVDPFTGPNHYAEVAIQVNGTVPVTLTQITLSVPAPYVRQPSTLTITPNYIDNYNGTNLMETPTTTWSSSATAVATVSGGVVTPVARGTFTITAASGLINATTSSLTVPGCTSIGLSPSGAQNLSVGGAVNITATPTCDSPYIDAATEPLNWFTSNSSVVTVSGTGTGLHVGHVTAVGAGTATVKACATLAPLPPGGLCSATVSVTVVGQPTISSVSTTPNPPKQYTPFTLTINGSSFDPATVQVVYSQPCYYPPGSWCSAVYDNSSISTKTATQLILLNRIFSIPGPIRIQARNGPSGTLSNYQTITIATFP